MPIVLFHKYYDVLEEVCLLFKVLEELKCNRYLKGPVCEQGYLVQGQDLVQVQIPQELSFEFKVNLLTGELIIL
jgi:hypothetical protein